MEYLDTIYEETQKPAYNGRSALQAQVNQFSQEKLALQKNENQITPVYEEHNGKEISDFIKNLPKKS